MSVGDMATNNKPDDQYIVFISLLLQLVCADKSRSNDCSGCTDLRELSLHRNTIPEW